MARANSKTDASSDVLRLFSPQVAAVLRKEFRYLSRNGFVLISLLMPPILVLLFSLNSVADIPRSRIEGFRPTCSFQE